MSARRGASSPNVRGVSRIISIDDAVVIAAAFLIQRDLRCTVVPAVALAEQLVERGGTVRISALVTITIDLPRLDQIVREASADVVAASPPPARGRPRRKKNRGAP